MKKLKQQATTSFMLEAMALQIPDFPDHPNRVPFSGVLTRLDKPSDRAPSGASGHRVVLPRAVAERALPSLLGMAVDYAPGLRGHDARRKIGVITRAEVAGDRLEVGGYLFGKDFPDVVQEVRARRESLGMSYEVTGVRVADTAADIWVLDNVTFTGAAILLQSVAAYQSTSLAANSTSAKPSSEKGVIMDQRIVQTLDLLARTSQTLTTELSELRSAVEELKRAQEEATQHFHQSSSPNGNLESRVDELARISQELRQQNEALRAQAHLFSTQAARKTIPPQVLTLLAKSGVAAEAVGSNGHVDVLVLDKALGGLPVEQRIAVKSQLARAGVLP